MSDSDPGVDRFAELRDHIIECCGRAGFVAPGVWVEWFLRLELGAVAERTGVSPGDAARAMTMGEAALIADEIIEVTRSSGAGSGRPRDTSRWN